MSHSQPIQDVDEFVSSWEQFWRNVALHHTCSEMYALQWMGAVRMRVQAADKNITIIIHTTPVQSISECLEKWKAVCLVETDPLLRHLHFKLLVPAKIFIHYS